MKGRKRDDGGDKWMWNGGNPVAHVEFHANMLYGPVKAEILEEARKEKGRWRGTVRLFSKESNKTLCILHVNPPEEFRPYKDDEEVTHLCVLSPVKAEPYDRPFLVLLSREDASLESLLVRLERRLRKKEGEAVRVR